MGFPGGSAIRHPPVGLGDVGLIPELGRASGVGNATYSIILAWKILWTEESGGLHSMGSQGVGHN